MDAQIHSKEMDRSLRALADEIDWELVWTSDHEVESQFAVLWGSLEAGDHTRVQVVPQNDGSLLVTAYRGTLVPTGEFLLSEVLARGRFDDEKEDAGLSGLDAAVDYVRMVCETLV